MHKLTPWLTLAIATLVSVPAHGSLVGGTGFSSRTLAPRQGAMYDLPFKPGEKAVIELTGDGKGELDCYVYDVSVDPSGRLLVKDDSPGDRCRIAFVPTTKDIVLFVKNVGTTTDAYTLLIP